MTAKNPALYQNVNVLNSIIITLNFQMETFVWRINATIDKRTKNL